MDKIEVGEYVRTKKGYIRQVVRRDADKHILLDIGFEGFNYLTQIEEKEDIVKHSKNIIELIEVGDYVNGYEVLDKYLFNGEKPVLETTGDDINCKCLCNSDIKSIVTKEQFEQVQYKVGD